MIKFCHIWSISTLLCFNESQKYSVAWGEVSGLKHRIILDRVVEGEEKTSEMLKNCPVQPFSPSPRKSIPQPYMNTCMGMLENSNANPECHASDR